MRPSRGLIARPLKPGKPLGPVKMTLCSANAVPFQLLQAWICGPDETYSVPSRQATPKANGGEPARRVAVPFSTTKTPPGVEPSSLPAAATKTLPAPKANWVGVGTPCASVSTALPFVAVGGGGGPCGCPADALTAPAGINARAQMTARKVRDRIMKLLWK